MITTLNVIVPTTEGVATFLYDYKLVIRGKSEVLALISVVSKFGVALLEVTSACFIAYSINKIRKFVNAGNREGGVRTSQLLKHFLAFGLYLLSQLVVLVFMFNLYVLNAKNPDPAKQTLELNIAFCVSVTLSFFA